MSVFLAIPEDAWVASNALAFAVRDRYPVSPGHTLVITRRVVPDFFAATPEERAALLALVEVVKQDLDHLDPAPDGYNVGFNAGAAAGQTVPHVHVHVIPRYQGDMDDPRGGVRHVIPSKGNYLREVHPLATGGERDPFARHVLPLVERATAIDIVAAFVQETGLLRVERSLQRALGRGARVRLVTGDYLAITQASALELLLDWQASAAEAADDADLAPGRLEARVVETEKLPGRTRTFHPKAWRLEGPELGVAFVGSSNLSLAALDTGIEWNLRVDRDRDAPAWERVGAAFEALWTLARPLDAAWIADYARRARVAPQSLPPGEAQAELLPPPAPPHEVQREALAALREARESGHRRALVVLATGLGKTWLAAFDYQQLWDECGRRPRLLFIAHCVEILRQAALTWRRLLYHRDPAARRGWFLDEHTDLEADLVFASVAKLARSEHRDRLASQRFDYVVVDEVHHAAAESYRRILDVLDPAFLLGLTATPDRADSADILGLFDDFLAYRAGIDRGIGVGRLVPFAYFGVRDDIDYKNIPWRNKRFDPVKLAEAAQTERRMLTLWDAWQAHPGARTLVFCCSVAHARYVKGWLKARDLRVAAVFAEAGSDDREAALEALALGQIDALCAVDVFNEGVDLPLLDRVVMLRPTESSVVFLQQLGRGLRAAEGKRALTVIDFVGNHRVFLERLRTLLSLGGAGRAAALDAFLRGRGPIELPGGCSVDVALEAKALLETLLQGGGADEVERAYLELKVTRGVRPRAAELLRLGLALGSLRTRHGSWFDFVASQRDDLSSQEREVLALAGGLLRELEVTPMTKCFKMVTLQALLEEDALLSGLPLEALAVKAAAILRRSPELLADVPDEDRPPEVPDARAQRAWFAYWRRNPITAWLNPKKDGRPWFALDGSRFALDLKLPPHLADTFAAMVRELVDLRLAQYRRRPSAAAAGVDCRVTWNQRSPILALPTSGRERLPGGEARVRLPDGAAWVFSFQKHFCNVAWPVGSSGNHLPELLRRWFGPRAGQPGTSWRVRFLEGPGGWSVQPLMGEVVPFPALRPVVAYPDLRAAAGHAAGEFESPEAERVLLPLDRDDPALFAVRVSGSSMDGGAEPLRDGDWAVLRLARSEPAEVLERQVVLVQLPGSQGGSRYQLKRLTRRQGRWWLCSDNPEGPSFEADEDMVVIARLERVFRPEALGPPPGTVATLDELSQSFGLEDGLRPATGRYGGHLFVFAPDPGDLVARVPDRRPGETAYVLAGVEGTTRYLGVARWSEQEGRWLLAGSR